MTTCDPRAMTGCVASTSVTVVAGVATLAGCQVDTPGSYTLGAVSSPSLTAASGTGDERRGCLQRLQRRRSWH